MRNPGVLQDLTGCATPGRRLAGGDRAHNKTKAASLKGSRARSAGRFTPSSRVALLGLALLLPFLVAWTGSWEGFAEASRRISTLDARFVQKKTLPILAKPFVSGGGFWFQSPASLRWEYDDPVRSVLLMHGGGVKRYLRDGNAWREEPGASLSVMQTVLSEIVNWQRGQFDANPHFQASLQAGSEPRVILVPREASWKKMIDRIELTPSREQAGVMKSVRVVEEERSFTLIEFHRVRLNRPLPGALFTNAE